MYVCHIVQPDVSSASRVDFEVPVTPVKNKVVRTNPPTPHPSATRPSLSPLAKALEDAEKEEEDLFVKQPSAEPKKRSVGDDRPKPKLKVATQSVDVVPPTKTASSSSPRQQKKAKKPKPAVDLGKACCAICCTMQYLVAGSVQLHVYNLGVTYERLTN